MYTLVLLGGADGNESVMTAVVKLVLCGMFGRGVDEKVKVGCPCRGSSMSLGGADTSPCPFAVFLAIWSAVRFASSLSACSTARSSSGSMCELAEGVCGFAVGAWKSMRPLGRSIVGDVVKKRSPSLLIWFLGWKDGG